MKPFQYVIIGLIFAVLAATAWLVWTTNQEIQQPVEEGVAGSQVTFLSPTECVGNHGVWRWTAKTQSEWNIDNPETVTIADLANLPPPAKLGTDSPRLPEENRVVKVRGKWVILKPEDDGDFHLGLMDPDGKTDVMLVVEVPLGDATGNNVEPWSDIRIKVASLGKLKFPCGPHEKKLDGSIILEVTGPIFWDTMHEGKIPNRRSYNPKIMVVEIHPVMKLEVIE